jgi:hypothetical protein
VYQPNFCSECGAQIVRERWHLWTSRRFCDGCAPRLRKQQLLAPLLAGGSLFGVGLAAGGLSQPAVPPLVMEQRPAALLAAPNAPAVAPQSAPVAPPAREVISMCGAQTKKGTPCSRRVHGTGRCFQHTGLAAMLPPERLILQR